MYLSFLRGFYCTKSLDPVDIASAGYAVGAEVKPSIPGQKQVKYGANAETIFAAVLLFKPANQPARHARAVRASVTLCAHGTLN